MLIAKEISGLFEELCYHEHASECGHHVAWAVYHDRSKPRTLRARRFDKAPRFKLCAECAAKAWRDRVAEAG
jgi:hypothetical protein